MQNPEKFVAGHLERKNKMEDIEKLIKELREHVDSEINRDLMVKAADALETILKEKNEIFSQMKSTESNMGRDLERVVQQREEAVKMSIDLECENFYIKKAIQDMMREVDAAKGCHDTQEK